MGTGIVDTLKQEFPLEDDWVSYEIHPETPLEGVPLERLFGPGIRQHQEGQRQRCEELGLPFAPPQLLSNSRLAVEAAEFAREAGKHPEFHRALLASYFAHEEDIGDIEVLGRVADEVALDTEELRVALASSACAERRQAAEREAHQLGISGVPTFFFGGGPRVVGAQPLDYFRRLLNVMVAGQR